MRAELKPKNSGSLFLLLLAGIGAGSLLVFLLLVLLGLFLPGEMGINAELEFGFPGPVMALIIWPVFTLLWVVLTWLLMLPGLWLLRKLRPGFLAGHGS